MKELVGAHIYLLQQYCNYGILQLDFFLPFQFRSGLPAMLFTAFRSVNLHFHKNKVPLDLIGYSANGTRRIFLRYVSILFFGTDSNIIRQ
jgi:hypothetical protein